jgi:short-subunit dehydrogenase
MTLRKSVAIITGGSSGIGAELGRVLASDGVRVVLAARRKQLLDDVAESITKAGGSATAVKCDVSVREDAEELIHYVHEEFGRLDILVNNAGRGHLSSVEDTTDLMIQSIFEVNVFSLWYTTRPALTYMKRQGSGHIINIASMAGKVGFPFNSAYVAAKHACVGFTHALRQELLETGIHASVVCPASVLTEWAMNTEGGPMLPLLSRSSSHVKAIAKERNITLPEIEGVMPPRAVAEHILECIRNPVPEVYTHKGSREFALLAAQDRVRAEQRQLPIVLGERMVYESLSKDKQDGER